KDNILGQLLGSQNDMATIRLDVVVVTVNYRLGHLGFFAHPALGVKKGHRLKSEAKRS
ncbi:carboxylesterase family protein, partial [Klebsiella pneumoniae]|nr:carboxylesterase family protein [Klebsiella pneumoniae]